MTAVAAQKAELLLQRRAHRIADELERAAADGWLIYDFRGSNPAFERLLSSHTKSTRRAFLFIPKNGQPGLLIHHVDASNFARTGLAVKPFSGLDDLLQGLADL